MIIVGVEHRMRQLRAIREGYRHCSLGVRLRVLGRYVLCPFGALLPSFPATGSVLDVGCGDGLLVLMLSLDDRSRRRSYLGIDVDPDKIANATRAGVPNAEFRAADLADIPAGSFDCVSVIDVLYLLPMGRWHDFLRHAVGALRPGGLLIVKEVADTPAWKYWIGYLEELVAIKIMRMTTGDMPHLESADTYRAAIEAAGAEILRIERIDAGRPHAHVLLQARKRAAP